MLSDWSDRFGLAALARDDLTKVDTIYGIILGDKNEKHISYDEIEFLNSEGFFLEAKLRYEIRSYSLFEDGYITTKLLREMLTPNLIYFDSVNSINCIFLYFSMKDIEIFANFVETFNLEGCVWTNLKQVGFTKLEFNYLHSSGAELNQFKRLGVKFDFRDKLNNKEIYKELKDETNWYYKLFRHKRYYENSRFRKLKDFKSFIQWKWISYWLPLAINSDISNIFDMNKYLVQKVSTKLKVKLDAEDILENLGIHVCQLIPDTLKILFNHYLNRASITLVTCRKIEKFSKDQWKYNHENLINIEKIYSKLQKYPNSINSNRWYIEYLLKLNKLSNREFKEYMEGDNLMLAIEKLEERRLLDKEIENEGFEINVIKTNEEEAWNDFRLKKYLEYLML